MIKAKDTIVQALSDQGFISLTFSAPRDKAQEVKNIIANSTNETNEIKVEYRLQKHNDIKTLKTDNFTDNLDEYLKAYKQCLIKTQSNQIQVLINKKHKSTIIKKATKVNNENVHNRSKNYLIPDGVKCDFLTEIGVMDKNGRVKSNYYKKFKQINRFLELVDDLYKDENSLTLHIVDFGCGKSYLTFALYHYFTQIKNFQVKITGIDLKQEVINHCNAIALKLNFSNLKFAHGFIHDFKTDTPVDFVVTLHACDTATDDAILFSLRNKAKKMMFVPCCQHELNKQIQNNESQIMLKHGIFKDRLTSLVTDTMRSQLLEACGFKVQSMEFIDLEHTAKNILLRCQLSNKSLEQKQHSLELYMNFKKQWKIQPYLETQLLKEKFI